MNNMNNLKLLVVTEPITTSITQYKKLYQIDNYEPEIIKLEETIRTIRENDYEQPFTKYSYELITTDEVKNNYGVPIVFKKDFLEYIKQNNPFGALGENKDYVLPIKSSKPNPDVTILFVNYSSHEIWDPNLNPVSYCKHLNYLGTPFTNEYVKLDLKFLDFLHEHPWVVNKNDLQVEQIPCYNATNKRYKYVPLSLYVDDETLKKIYAEISPVGRSCWIDEEGRTHCKDINYYITSYLFSRQYSKSLQTQNYTDWFGIEPYLK